ncbi:MAG: hypothetical protein PHU88_12110 [candidate division Zixibacteria bacterium]|nr:hypothetical protein [candidate division Zixibacteria bacterium]MDD5425953.1 hypothetical protein [candidate division Zixibacteria bacterium]
MLSGLEKLKTRRAWLVPDFMVWGLPGLGDLEFLAVEKVGTVRSVFFGRTDIVDTVQEVSYSQLTDHRGNQLPAVINAPLVMPRCKSEAMVYVIGQEADTGFKIARASVPDHPVTADLLIMEMGN